MKFNEKVRGSERKRIANIRLLAAGAMHLVSNRIQQKRNTAPNGAAFLQRKHFSEQPIGMQFNGRPGNCQNPKRTEAVS